MILTARTTRGREKTAIKEVQTEVRSGDLQIYAVFHPEELKGYIFIEGEEPAIRELASESRHIRGVIDDEVKIDEIEKYLSEEEEEIRLEVGDTVEVIGGAFKGEEAQVKRIDDTNREITIELLDAAVPIPTTVDVDMVRKSS